MISCLHPYIRLAGGLMALILASLAQARSGPWIELPHAKARLIVSGDAASGQLLAGLDIQLEAGWKTYWRYPGSSGIPPLFDWSKARNVANAEVQFPAPQRFHDPYGETFGYQTRVLFPIKITLAEAGQPTILDVDVSLGICREICIPVDQRLSLSVPPLFTQDTAVDKALNTALQTVPQPAPQAYQAQIRVLEAFDSSRVLAIAIPSGNPDPDFVVDDVIVEGPQNWFITRIHRVTFTFSHHIWQLSLKGSPSDIEIEGTPMRLFMIGADRKAYIQDFTLDPLQ